MLQRFKMLWLAALSALLLIGALLYGYMREDARLVGREQLDALIQKGGVDEAYASGDYLYLRVKENTYRIPEEVIDPAEIYDQLPFEVREPSDWMEWIVTLAVLGVLSLLTAVILKANRQRTEALKAPVASSDGLIQAAHIQPMSSPVRFDDVAGIDEVKGELLEIVDFLKAPKRYSDFGIRLPKGVLLVGPPGVGKTLIAKALAGEAGVPFFYQSGSSFVQIYVGVGAKRVRELFATAKKHAPAIIFIDEIDAVGKARGGGRNDEREATLNQLLTEMDGFEDNSGIIVVAATNKIEMLDDALLRAGRFDRRVHVGLPGFNERQEILAVHLRGKPHEVNLPAVARQTVGFSAAALANLVNEAALKAFKEGNRQIGTDEMLAVRDKVMSGTRKMLSFTDTERELLSLYQSARVVVAWEAGFDFERVNMLGYGYKQIEHEIISEQELLGRIRFLLAGRVALEEATGQSYSLGVEDLAQAQALTVELWERYGVAIKEEGSREEYFRRLYTSTREAVAKHYELIAHISRVMMLREEVSRSEVIALANELV